MFPADARTASRGNVVEVARCSRDVDVRHLTLGAFGALVQVENLDSFYAFNPNISALSGYAQPLIAYRGDSHYGRPEAMEWCEANGCGYVFGMAGNSVLDGLVAEAAEHLGFWHALSEAPKTRGYAQVEYQAKSWSRPRRVVARIEVSLQPDGKGGLSQETDIRYVVTSLTGRPEHIYEDVYCQRGEAENLIKLHKSQLASNHTSCRSPLANQFRVILHTATY